MSSDTTNWIIGVSVIAVFLTFVLIVCCIYNKLNGMMCQRDVDAPPRPKLKLSVVKQAITPVDKRILLKTGNYTVEQSWEQVTVKFYNREFFDRFRDALLSRYTELVWRDPRKPQEGCVTSNAGLIINLEMKEEMRSLVVSNEGNTLWVMNDFQAICKKVNVPEVPERHADIPAISLRALSPRQATIGEEFYDAGDYNVKISQSEVEIKFTCVALFEKFKRYLLIRYSTLPWSKYLQRDCAQVTLANGKKVTIHLWEDVHSIWLTGDGKKDWYHQEFQELYSGTVNESAAGVSETRRRKSVNTSSTSVAHCDPQAKYTVKTLDDGGLEIEFTTSEYVRVLKTVIEQSRHRPVSWSDSGGRHVTRLMRSERGHAVMLSLGTVHDQPRKMWIYNKPACVEWFNGEFKLFYTTALDKMRQPAQTKKNSSEATTCGLSIDILTPKVNHKTQTQ